MAIRVLQWCLGAAVLLAAGCVDFNYVGQEFAPTPKSQKVAYFVKRSQIPVGEYRIIGRATVDAPDGTDGYDIRDLLLEKARSYGADAVCLVSAKRVKVGMYELDDSEFAGPNPAMNPGNITYSGTPIEENSFGDTVDLRGEVRFRMEVVVKALFLKNKAELEKLLAERGRELDELLGEKSEPSRPEEPAKEEFKLPNDDGEDLSSPEEPETAQD